MVSQRSAADFEAFLRNRNVEPVRVLGLADGTVQVGGTTGQLCVAEGVLQALLGGRSTAHLRAVDEAVLHCAGSPILQHETPAATRTVCSAGALIGMGTLVTERDDGIRELKQEADLAELVGVAHKPISPSDRPTAATIIIGPSVILAAAIRLPNHVSRPAVLEALRWLGITVSGNLI